MRNDGGIQHTLVHFLNRHNAGSFAAPIMIKMGVFLTSPKDAANKNNSKRGNATTNLPRVN